MSIFIKKTERRDMDTCFHTEIPIDIEEEKYEQDIEETVSPDDSLSPSKIPKGCLFSFILVITTILISIPDHHGSYTSLLSTLTLLHLRSLQSYHSLLRYHKSYNCMIF